MMARWLAFLIWAAAAAAGVFWGLKLFTRPLPPPAHAVVVATAAAAGGDMTRLFGVEAPAPVVDVPQAAPEVASNRFQLIGVVASRADRAHVEGVALIAVDGKTPRAYKVGSRIDGDHILQEVKARGVSIGPRGGQTLVALELPALPPPSTGVLPAASMSGDAPTAPAPSQPVFAPASAQMAPNVQPTYVPAPPPQADPQDNMQSPAQPAYVLPPPQEGQPPPMHPRSVPHFRPPGARQPSLQIPVPANRSGEVTQ